ncbi:fumarylacetoacetate hydrolase family protein [Ancylobacter lacus]|uniref:fumarylacetoacetate hydrolase family protein n=1 Tax=Ancylobacter lacus TaxID=2579970 RepID=UPI0031B86CF8
MTDPALPRSRVRPLTPGEILPADPHAVLIGRVWSHAAGGPCPVLVADGRVRDLSAVAPTLAGLMNLPGWFPREAAAYPDLGALADYLGAGGEGPAGRLLAPIDLQAVKAAGVTFVDSMLERVIDERTKGDASAAEAIRRDLHRAVGDRLSAIVPGSEAASRAKALLQELGYWSQYLEVGIGPDAEIFTKVPPMSSVGCGAQIGLHPISQWNNPEPEVVMVVNARGEIRGATLGNDVNLRDVEGRSALLLSKAKDNNGSCAIGPFIRLFDAGFSLADAGRMTVTLNVEGPEGFKLESVSEMARISRSPADLVGQTINRAHQYPDGFVLFLGTMFAPVVDREGEGLGFTHHMGDEVRIHTPELGTLVNWVERSDAIPEWTFGTLALMENLARRNLLGH